MKYFEFGQQNETLMVLLHGGGVCYRGVLPVAERLSKEFHVIVVAYDGFNPTEPDTEYRFLFAPYSFVKDRSYCRLSKKIHIAPKSFWQGQFCKP